MSAAKHTPGPWMVSFDATRYAIHQCEEINGVQHRRTPIAFVPKFTKNDSFPAEEHRTILQDARLIAAAPELLEALRICASQSTGPDWTPGQALGFIRQHAHAAIAKATGSAA